MTPAPDKTELRPCEVIQIRYDTDIEGIKDGEIKQWWAIKASLAVLQGKPIFNRRAKGDE